MWLDDLAVAVRGSGLAVWEDPRWRSRDHGPMSAVRGVVCHHTGSSGSGAWTVVRDGRADLPGPLAQLTLERDGSVRVLSHGQCWHAGTGSWPSIGRNNGNANMIGIECVYNGADITDAQRRAYPRLVAALCRHYRIPIGNVIGHKEWAPGRKSDPGKVDMGQFRRDVAALVNGSAPPAPTPAPAARSEVAIQNFPHLTGKGRLPLGLPVGNGAFTSEAYLSVVVEYGKGSAHVYAQGATAGISDWWHPENELTVATTGPQTNLARRSARRVPAGTSVLLVDYDFSGAGPNGGTLTVETR